MRSCEKKERCWNFLDHWYSAKREKSEQAAGYVPRGKFFSRTTCFAMQHARSTHAPRSDTLEMPRSCVASVPVLPSYSRGQQTVDTGQWIYSQQTTKQATCPSGSWQRFFFLRPCHRITASGNFTSPDSGASGLAGQGWAGLSAWLVRK